MHVPAVTFLTVISSSLAASSLPLYEGMLYARGEQDILVRDPTVLESIVRRANEQTLARAVDLAERALANDMVVREYGHPVLQERFFPLFSAFKFIGKGAKALADKIRHRKKRPKRSLVDRDFMDGEGLVERDINDLDPIARDIVEILYERDLEDSETSLMARFNEYPEQYARDMDGLD